MFGSEGCGSPGFAALTKGTVSVSGASGVPGGASVPSSGAPSGPGDSSVGASVAAAAVCLAIKF